MKTILVPTDFSSNATNALNFAAGLAGQVRGKLIIVHIINLPVTPLNGVIIPPDAQLVEDCKQELNRLSKELRLENGFRFEVETICLYGYFLANLNEIAKAKAVDLVVMGTKGATNFLDKLIGTNTSGFIQIATCPVLAIPAEAKFSGLKQIAYASDFECEESVFLQQLFSFAEPFRANVSIINILTERQLNIFADNQVIRDITRQFPDNNYSIAQIQEQSVVKGLQEFILDNQVDVLAVSIQERTFLESLFHKSISKQLIYNPRIPLLALPQKASAKAVRPVIKPKQSLVAVK